MRIAMPRDYVCLYAQEGRPQLLPGRLLRAGSGDPQRAPRARRGIQLQPDLSLVRAYVGRRAGVAALDVFKETSS